MVNFLPSRRVVHDTPHPCDFGCSTGLQPGRAPPVTADVGVTDVMHIARCGLNWAEVIGPPTAY